MSIYGLGLIGTGRHAAEIMLALHDRSSAVRVAAIDALDRFEAARVLDRSSERKANAATIATLSNDRNAIVRGRAAIALGEFASGPMGDASSVALATALGREKSDPVRERIAWTIFRSYPINVPRETLTSLLHDSNEVVRIEAVRALGRVKNRDAIPALQAMLADPSWRVQEQAAESILVLQGKNPHDHWTAIPPYVHVPAVEPDALADVAALPRAGVAGKPVAPNPLDALTTPTIDPKTAADMAGPAHGPHPRMRLVTTKGDIYVVLYPEWAPVTVENFMNVADDGYFDHNRWFRIVPDFVVQTGDPNDNGDGDAGYTIGAEENPVDQHSYVISMGMNYTDPPNAHAIRDSAGTQFYITLSPQFHLDRDFTVFGQVTSGFDVLGRLIEPDRIIRVERLPDVTL
jgi:peptidyl-prolyl cis-trans isomerase B (cyclophilin B)